MSSRRKFLQGAAVGSGVLGLAPVAALASVRIAGDPDLGFERLRALIGSEFALLDDEGALSRVRLARLRSIDCDARVEQVQLYFDQPTSDRLSERSYRLHHRALGQISLFLQPINAAGQCWAGRSDLCLFK